MVNWPLTVQVPVPVFVMLLPPVQVPVSSLPEKVVLALLLPTDQTS